MIKFQISMWPVLLIISLWGCGFSVVSILVFGILKFRSACFESQSNRLLIFSEKAIKYSIYLLLFFCCLVPFSFHMYVKAGYLYKDNSLQKSKSHALEKAIFSQNENLKDRVFWSPAFPKTCFDHEPRIQHSKCLNFLFEINEEHEIFSVGAQLLDAIKKSAAQNQELYGDYIAITPIKKKSGCGDSPPTSYTLGICFVWYYQVLIKIEK